MKITKKGKPRAARKWTGSCSSCGAEATAEAHEMTHVTDDQKDQVRFSWEACPACGGGDKGTGYGGMLFYEERE